MGLEDVKTKTHRDKKLGGSRDQDSSALQNLENTKTETHI